MSSFQPLLVTLVCCVVSFFICGIPFGLIVGRIWGGTDIRDSGSGNIGTTNALRVAGPKVAAATLILDVLKGVLCVQGARMVIAALGYGAPVTIVAPGAPGDWMLVLVALACLYGHIFSPYLGFKGGKGIAVGVGILFGWYWPLALVHLAIFIVLTALTRYVSVGSIVTAGVVPLTVSLVFPYASLPAKLIMAVLGFSVVVAHRANIVRLKNGTESKLSFHKRTE